MVRAIHAFSAAHDTYVVLLRGEAVFCGVTRPIGPLNARGLGSMYTPGRASRGAEGSRWVQPAALHLARPRGLK